jgi:hypothetical protein
MTDPFAYSFEDAFYGPLGEYARRNETVVEIDSLSLLLQLLTVTGVAIGRRAYAYGGQDRHYPNLFTLIVGRTGIGKGGSGTVANQLGEAIDPGFKQRTSYNVASGPALVQLVTDGLFKSKTRRGKDGDREEIEVVHKPVEDKRLLLFLPEFGSTLVAQKRDGATLRDELKNAWDGRTIENNKYNCRERATNPHICLIGHITPVDLKAGSTRADVGNGYLNRFLITEARPARSLPFHVPPPDCHDLLEHIRGVLERLGPVNQSARCLEWAEDVRDEWAVFYKAFKDGRHPFIADVLELAGRLHAEVMLVALIYAVLDEASAIQLRHLRAGKAVCFEALDRIRQLFTATSVRVAQADVVQELQNAFAGRAGEWTRTALHDDTNRQHDGQTLDRAASALVASGEWTIRNGKAGNGHDAKFWSWAVSAEAKAEDTPTLPFEEEEIDAPEPTGIITVEGIRFRPGMPIAVRYDATALDFSGGVTVVQGGQQGSLASLSPCCGETGRDRARNRLSEHPNHVCVLIEDRAFFVPPKAIKEISASEAVLA